MNSRAMDGNGRTRKALVYDLIANGQPTSAQLATI